MQQQAFKEQHHSVTPTAPAAEEFHSGDRKRRRKALSCFECRRRKLRCDREYPSCGRCVAQAQTCTYESTSFEPKSLGSLDYDDSSKSEERPPLLDSFVGDNVTPLYDRNGLKNPQPRARLPDLDDEMMPPSGSLQGYGEVEPVILARDKRTIAKIEESKSNRLVYFKGASFATTYYGGTNPTSQISHFPELRSFMKEAIMQHSSLPRVQRDVKGLQVRWKTEKAEALPFTDANLFGLLPERETVDHLCRLYFDMFETSYRILHGPTFWKEYETLWDGLKTPAPSLLVTVLVMMATVSCISTKKTPTYVGDSSKARETAILWVRAAQSWLERQSPKHATIEIWQIRCLLLMASLTNTVKKKRTWTSAGNLLRQAMSAGFHRDPALLGTKISVFDQEMRRRLWATMVELELQISIDRGMPSASAGVPCDTAPPLNIDDESLSELDLEAPTPKPKDKYTASSYLYLSKNSLALRVSLTSALNGLTAQIPHEEVMVYDERINEKLMELPAWTNTGAYSKGSRALDVPRMLLDIQLRQFLLLIHGPYARRAEPSSRNSLSKMACFNSATRILDQNSRLATAGNYSLALLRADVYRSAILICHYAHVSTTIRNDVSLAKLSGSFFQHIESALNILEERITRLGTGYTHYWYVSAANALLHLKASSGNATAQKYQAVDKVLRQYYKVLASQEDLANVKANAPFNVIYKPRAADTPVPSFDDLIASNLAPQGPINDPYEYYYGDPAAWVFDDLPTFDQMEMPEL